jgi:hypothetical protein
MISRLGDVIYWAGLLCAAVAAFIAVNNVPDRIMYIIVTIGWVLLGWAIRYVLSGKKTFKP